MPGVFRPLPSPESWRSSEHRGPAGLGRSPAPRVAPLHPAPAFPGHRRRPGAARSPPPAGPRCARSPSPFRSETEAGPDTSRAGSCSCKRRGGRGSAAVTPWALLRPLSRAEDPARLPLRPRTGQRPEAVLFSPRRAGEAASPARRVPVASSWMATPIPWAHPFASVPTPRSGGSDASPEGTSEPTRPAPPKRGRAVTHLPGDLALRRPGVGARLARRRTRGVPRAAPQPDCGARSRGGARGAGRGQEGGGSAAPRQEVWTRNPGAGREAGGGGVSAKSSCRPPRGRAPLVPPLSRLRAGLAGGR